MNYRIDYFQQIKAFDYLCLTGLSLAGITASQRSVYHALLSVNNSTYWSEVFEIDFKYILDLSRVDKDTYRRAMDFFNENELFDSYVKGVNHYAKAKVSLKVLHEISVGNTVGNQVPNTVANAVNDTVPSAHINKTVNHKTIKTINKNIDFDLIFNDDEFLNSPQQLVDIFKRWINHKKEAKENFKSVDSLITSFKQLKKFSGENIQDAEQIVDISISNGWKGLFALKKEISKSEAPVGKATGLLNQMARLKLAS